MDPSLTQMPPLVNRYQSVMGRAYLRQDVRRSSLTNITRTTAAASNRDRRQSLPYQPVAFTLPRTLHPSSLAVHVNFYSKKYLLPLGTPSNKASQSSTRFHIHKRRIVPAFSPGTYVLPNGKVWTWRSKVELTSAYSSSRPLLYLIDMVSSYHLTVPS